MIFGNTYRRYLITTLLVIWLWLFSIGSPTLAEQVEATPHAVGVNDTYNQLSEYDWAEIDRSLTNALKVARQNTEQFTQRELSRWNEEVQGNLDEFLDWYFNFIHVKATEMLVPFAYGAFAIDFLKIFRTEDEKKFTVNEVISKRMQDEFNRKFTQLVLNDRARSDLEEILRRMGENYAAAVSINLAKVQAQYNIRPIDWENHLQQIAQLVYDVGTSKYDLNGGTFTGNLVTAVTTITIVAVSTKMMTSLAAKATAKMAAKGSGFLIAESAARFANPVLGIGVLIWDVWDYGSMVSKTRPALKQDLENYISEFQGIVFDDAVDAIIEVESNLILAIEKEPLSFGY